MHKIEINKKKEKERKAMSRELSRYLEIEIKCVKSVSVRRSVYMDKIFFIFLFYLLKSKKLVIFFKFLFNFNLKFLFQKFYLIIHPTQLDGYT